MRDYWRNRTFCDVLEEIRMCHKTRNYAHLAGLVEELQTLGNRMESGLGDKKDLKAMNDEWSEKKRELRKLSEEHKCLESKIDKLKEEVTGLQKKKDKLRG